MRKMLLPMSLVLVAVGLAVFVYDAYTSHRFGVHLNEVAGVTDEGIPIEWPTGERPTFTLIPVYIHALACWPAAAGVFSLRFRVGNAYQGRICRGTE